MDPRPLPALLLIWIAGCSPETSSSRGSFPSIQVPGGTKVETFGVRIEVADSVRYRFVKRTLSDRAFSKSATLNGHPFGVRDGVFFIGAQEYGRTPAGALVRVSAEGVFVDGERRGQVPSAAPDEAGE